MIVKLADNIISPLGLTSRENYEAVRSGKTGVCRHEHAFGLPEPFCGALLDRPLLDRLAENEIEEAWRYTLFEKILILSVSRAVAEAGIDAGRDDVLFVLSSTKGNVDCLQDNPEDEKAYLGQSAEKLAAYFGNRNPVAVVSNACISGVCAQIAGVRALESGKYRYAIVTGCDLLSKFIVSGFQSFKALSDDQCRPFDKDRKGLNLGEAAATMILTSCGRATDGNSFALTDGEIKEQASEGEVSEFHREGDGRWEYIGGAIHNDANHISGPSRTGEGSFRVLRDILESHGQEEKKQGKEDFEPESGNLEPGSGSFGKERVSLVKDKIGFVNVHGTSTAYNDEMESIAITRAGLADVPVNGLKGYFGHTLGAAGILETIVSMLAIEERTVLATKGFENQGTSCRVAVSNEIRHTDKNAFLKILSGFGGTNAGIGWEYLRTEGSQRMEQTMTSAERVQSLDSAGGSQRMEQTVTSAEDAQSLDSAGGSQRMNQTVEVVSVGEVHIEPGETSLNGKVISNSDISGLYREFIGGYPKFFKMDMLCRLGFVAAELLLRDFSPEELERAAVVLFNRNGSLITDRNYQQTLAADNYFPSPALFVYTLANIVTGEIAIRHKIYGETSFYVLPRYDEAVMREIVDNVFQTSTPSMVLTGWVDYENPQDYLADMKIYKKNQLSQAERYRLLSS